MPERRARRRLPPTVPARSDDRAGSLPPIPDRAHRRPHLLLCGWYCEGTGFTRVLQALLPHFARRFRITWIGVGYRGEPRQLAPHVRLLPTNLRGGDLMGAWALRQDWARHAPDIVFALNDIWYLEHYSRELVGVRGDVPLIGYCPLDGDIPDPQLIAGLRGFHSVYTYTAHAAAELRGAVSSVGLAVQVGVAGHGIDPGAFLPAPEVRAAGLDAGPRMQQAQALFGLDAPAWVVLNASRPDPRKRIDLSLAGFAHAAQSLPPEVRLCLHQAIAHPEFVTPLREQARALGIEQRLIWWPNRPGPVSDAYLNALYNACAVGLNTSHGEGFGLVSFEHAATAAPQVLPDHPALRELWGEAAWRLPTQALMTPNSPLRMGQVAACDVGEAIGQLHQDPIRYAGLARAALQRCAAPDLRWERVAATLLRGLLSALATRASSRVG